LGKLVPGLSYVGLTGGIGCGKSTVGRLLAEHGFPIVDADQLAREAVATGTSTHAAIAARWPEVLNPDGSLDRRKLSARVFSEPGERLALEGLTHPAIAALSVERGHALAAAGHEIAIYEASLLVETGRHGDFDGLIVVTAPLEERLRRVMSRDGSTRAQVQARMAAQLPEEAKVAVATHLIANDGNDETLRRRVDALASELHALRGAHPQRM
jgi:dephospho-CoA kinase